MGYTNVIFLVALSHYSFARYYSWGKLGKGCMGPLNHFLTIAIRKKKTNINLCLDKFRRKYIKLLGRVISML